MEYKIDNRIFMMARKASEERTRMLEQHGEYSQEYAAAHARFCALWDVIEEFGLVHNWLIYDGKNPVEYGY
ncbi:MAG: hypothetical protein RR998_08490 [Oscillospiraceae bacterium]